MIRHLLILLAGAMLAACESDRQGPVPAEEPLTSSPVASAAASRSGKDVYDEVCANCHAEGSNGAPKIGDRAAWAGRSQLWQAVLFAHAQNGYLDMPAKGGATSLDEADVARAAEYMLMQTYPEVRPD